MTDQIVPPHRHPNRLRNGQRWINRQVKGIKRYFQKRRAEKNSETAQDRSARRTATATIWIAIFTLVTAAVGAVTYTAINGQLGVMRRQLDEMKATGLQTDSLISANEKLANAAVKQADVWRTSQRAYVYVQNFETFKNGDQFGVRADIRNFGYTPARDTRIDVNTEFKSIAEEDLITFPSVEAGKGASTTIAPQQPLSTSMVVISMENAIKIWRNEIIFLIYVRIAYEDTIALEHHLTEDCVVVHFRVDPTHFSGEDRLSVLIPMETYKRFNSSN